MRMGQWEGDPNEIRVWVRVARPATSGRHLVVGVWGMGGCCWHNYCQQVDTPDSFGFLGGRGVCMGRMGGVA